MSAILRLAGGLDRSHSGAVRDVQIRRSADRLELLAVAPDNPEVDLWGARRRSKMFQKVFHTPLAIEWDGDEAAGAAENVPAANDRAAANGDPTCAPAKSAAPRDPAA
jgi:exopolyphosphatase/guanosine-5'-triphosphate,3'-diphosphate pyrophosphatase